MPPRIPIPSRLGSSSLCFRPAPKPSNGPLSIIQATNAASVSTFAQRKAHKDPYALAQSAQRKRVNLERQKVLQVERKEALGDPVRGITTPFLASFDNVAGSAVLETKTAEDGSYQGVEVKTGDDVVLNHFLTPSEFENSIKTSYALAEPLKERIQTHRDPLKIAEANKEYEEGHARATMALARIISLANASQKDKTRANIRRCIKTFGRHETDKTLNRRAPVDASLFGGKRPQWKTPRAGPDTGSSEVQIAILTAKIRVLADQLEKKGGNKDKVNKRNLRVMVHKRQKHLNYLRKKERGSERWQNLISTLGLTEGTWNGEISL